MIHLLFVSARLFQHRVIRMQRGADREAFIAGGRLNPGAAEWRSRKQFAVGHAVEGTASRHGEIFFGNAFVQFVRQMEKHFLKDMLHGVGQVHIALRDFGVRFARSAE